VVKGCRRDRDVGRYDEQRVAVGRGLGDHIGADRAGRSGTVLDEDLLLPALHQALGHETPERVGAAPWRERHDDAHDLRRIGLGAGFRREQRRTSQDRCDDGGDQE